MVLLVASPDPISVSHYYRSAYTFPLVVASRRTVKLSVSVSADLYRIARVRNIGLTMCS